jgi:hypothetical protein
VPYDDSEFISKVHNRARTSWGRLLARSVNKIQSDEYHLRPCTMGVLREGAYKNKPSILLSIGAYLYRGGA